MTQSRFRHSHPVDDSFSLHGKIKPSQCFKRSSRLAHNVGDKNIGVELDGVRHDAGVYRLRDWIATESAECRKSGSRKVPMWIYLKSRKPFTFPGLWDFWLDRDTGSQFYTLTIITTRANGMVRRLHDRMPMIYDPPRAGSG
jgi:SOS response associated peptidase (SRAP)